METTRKFRKGDKVYGNGRGGRVWNPRPLGTVTQNRGGWVRVQWDACCVEDDMRASELSHADDAR